MGSNGLKMHDVCSFYSALHVSGSGKNSRSTKNPFPNDDVTKYHHKNDLNKSVF
jgi:hypothetical protein